MFKSTYFKGRLSYSLFFLCALLLGTSISETAYAKRSPEEVFKYQKHMAQAGYSSAIYKLALMYQNGYGTPRDLKKALELYKESARKGYKKAEEKITEVEIMIESGDFPTPKVDAKQKVLEKERAKIKQEKKRLREERDALNRAQREARAAQLEEQRRKRKEANDKKWAEQKRLSDERRKLNEEMAKLRKERIQLAREKREIEAAKEMAAEDEMRALEESIELLMDDGISDEERRTMELMSE
ncbi:MAG: hypothetical protein GQ470_06630 [Gammaproteobacteria bacterium]|nr:hypothetical protein [Gammaproteobacteria bacterium]